MPDYTITGQQGGEPVYVGVSTKMYLGYRASLDWLARIRHEVDTRPALAAGRVVPFVIPSFPVLPAAAALLEGAPMLLGAQNCGWADGPWTGEVAPSMLAELGVRLVEIGHAERRRHFHEDNAVVARKVRAADDAGLTPLLCVGEDSVGEGGALDAARVVHGQIQAAVGGDWTLASRLVVAYEPVWAIGAAEPADAWYVSDVVRHLRALLAGDGLPEVPVIYGGSAKPGTLPRLDGVSGLFLGRFAHDAANFGRVLDEALELAAKNTGCRAG
ncbi:triosephosphate isomerase [Pseudarthrobacter phenanthrenivorans Sphe3]|uniref:Triosephosphate isomerase n=1 Tax=Pseudarthrobacter phenanthrenivorans (strain DSM 18606 / JCM 16027 / LMG 23796 / Sphe3) TaxID=930171 RepID=F0M203_PSEPM|nr:triose-phosphate isomerase family protein [Pseudarthrobacter phenanthrenivorans]ADX73155.1 triosephosphate isomerase [Pseudarthrobacter phenanthrenivorans Sphe3]